MKSIPELSVDTQIIAKRLSDLKSGEMVPYEELSKLIKADVRNDKRHILESARRKVLSDHQIVTAAVWGEGIKRLSNDEIPSVGAHATRHIRRTTTKALRRVSCCEPEKLKDAEKIVYNMNVSVLGALKVMTQPQSLKRLTAAVQGASDKLAVGRTLEIFQT